jgi:hypothetical protein
LKLKLPSTLKAFPFGPVERGIDVVFEFNGQRLGAQHTIFHFDEG